MEDIDNSIRLLSDSDASSSQLEQTISSLATASRSTVELRTKLGTPEVLQRLAQIVEKHLADSLPTVNVALRCIGNSCIDNDAAREAITEVGFGWAKTCLAHSDPAIRTLTVLVLTNVCLDYEAAQKKCFVEGLHVPLISIAEAAATYGEENDRHYPVELLFWITNQKGSDAKGEEDGGVKEEPLTDELLKKLLSLPYLHRLDSSKDDEAATDHGDFATILETVITFLRDTAIQSRVVEMRLVNYVWQMLLLNEARIAALTPEDEEDRALLVPMSTNLTWCLSDIAANEDFSKKYPTTEDAVAESADLIAAVETTIGASAGSETKLSPSTIRIANAACQVLGNFLWALPVESSGSYVEDKSLHVPLWQFLSDTDDADLLHSAAGLLIQLTRPSARIREIVGSAENVEPALVKLCRHDTPQLKQDGIKLLRSLGKECAVNQKRFAVVAQEVMQNAPEATANEGTPKVTELPSDSS